MHVKILGCHGSDGLLDDPVAPRPCNTCGFLLNDVLLLDAGTVASALSLAEQNKIRHILLSHLHFDHIRGLPTLADNISEQASTPVVVAGLSEVIDGLHRNIFNSDVYPDFFTIPSAEKPVLTSQPLKPGQSYSLSGVSVTPVLVNHTVPTSGFIVQNGSTGFVYSGDTWSTDELWHEARRIPRLKAAFIECSYPNAMDELARASKHLTPALFAEELAKLDRTDLAVYAYHLKPAFKAQVVRELTELNIPNLHILEEGRTLTI
jgi:cAMP phosphodiesterase